MNERISISATVDRDAMADEVQHFNKALADNLSRAFDLTAPGAPKMFANNIFVRLDVEDLYKVFIDALDERTAAEYDCSCCRSFVRRFLSTAILDTATGEIVHTLFPQASQVEDRFKPGADAVQARLSKAGVIGVFPTKDLAHGHRILGVKQAGGFSHFHFAVDDVTARRLIAVSTVDADARLTQREELRDMLVRSLTSHDAHLVKSAVIRLQNAITGHEANKFINNLNGFLEAQERINKVSGINRSRLLNAYAMFGNQAVIRMDTGGALLGTFLERVKEAGQSEYAIGKAMEWLEHNSNGIRYRRQSAAPANGTIERANKIFAEKGLAPSMARRALRLDEVVGRVWERGELASTPAEAGGFFDKLKTDAKPAASTLPPRKRTVRRSMLGELLPQYTKLFVEMGNPHSVKLSLIGFTTATNPEAPPLFKWDNEEDRYPYAAYVLHKPVPVDAHGPELTAELALTGRAEIAVVSNMAERMNGQPGLLGFLVNGRQVSGGSGIFPENLRADLKEVDHVIDLHSKQDRLTGMEDSCVALWLSGKVIGVLADGSEEHLTLVEAE